MEELIIDRFEDPWFVCEKNDKTHIKIEKEKFPDGAKEGDCCIFSSSGEIVIDEERTKERKNRIKKLMESLKKR